MNEHELLVVARLRWLSAVRDYQRAMRAAEDALAIRKTMPGHQFDKSVPALLKRQA